MAVVAICGFIGAGKDTVADFLINDYGFEKASFAGALKDAVAAVFGWDREMLEGRTQEAREWREQVDTWWADRLAMPHLTPRWVLQYWGTEVCRKGFHNDIWVASVENRLRSSSKNIVLTDCRFPNEVQAMRNLGAKVVWIKRGPLPDWYSTALAANQGNSLAQQELVELKIHASETSWVGTRFDFELRNDTSLEDLRAATKVLVG